MAQDSEDGFDMEQYKTELDQTIAGVMPDDHPVHDRL
jgi:hypothetical protein